MYVWRNTEARSRNRCYRGETISITYCECVFVALGIHHADGTFSAHHYIVICGRNCYTIVLHITS
jgi:hypothetical protein